MLDWDGCASARKRCMKNAECHGRSVRLKPMTWNASETAARRSSTAARDGLETTFKLVE
jgi:hypothetical protein